MILNFALKNKKRSLERVKDYPCPHLIWQRTCLNHYHTLNASLPIRPLGSALPEGEDIWSLGFTSSYGSAKINRNRGKQNHLKIWHECSSRLYRPKKKIDFSPFIRRKTGLELKFSWILHQKMTWTGYEIEKLVTGLKTP